MHFNSVKICKLHPDTEFTIFDIDHGCLKCYLEFLKKKRNFLYDYDNCCKHYKKEPLPFLKKNVKNYVAPHPDYYYEECLYCIYESNRYIGIHEFLTFNPDITEKDLIFSWNSRHYCEHENNYNNMIIESYYSRSPKRCEKCAHEFHLKNKKEMENEIIPLKTRIIIIEEILQCYKEGTKYAKFIKFLSKKNSIQEKDLIHFPIDVLKSELYIFILKQKSKIRERNIRK